MKITNEIERIQFDSRETIKDELAREVEYQLEVNGKTAYTFFCSPTELDALATGYLFTHQYIRTAEELIGLDFSGNKIRVEINQRYEIQNTFPETNLRLRCKDIFSAMENLNALGRTFQETGGTHIAGLLHRGEISFHSEDISRHNAIMKVLGKAFRNNIELSQSALLLSCRITASVIALVQNTRLPILCSQSAVSSLAARQASALGLSVSGFIRQGRMNLYSGNQRFI
jgi:formate dehydrogenase assembly factor FdhD